MMPTKTFTVFIIVLISVTLATDLLDKRKRLLSSRGRSKFRISNSPNPFDRTQPRASLVRPERVVASAPKDAVVAASSDVKTTPKRRRRPSAGVRRRIGAAAKTQAAENGKTRERRKRIRIPGRRRKTQAKPDLLVPTFTEIDDNSIAPFEAPSKSKGYKVVCYYTNWSQYRPKIGKFLPEHIDPHICTHIIYAFGWLKKGRLSSFEGNDETKDGKIGFYEKITGLKRRNPKLKVLLALGGWTFGTKRFRDMAGTRYSRQRFIFSAIPFLRKHNFDGLDLDWEYPAGKKDKNNLNQLCQELMEAFKAEAIETKTPRLLLTAAVAVGPDKVKGGYDHPTLGKILDFINVMSYDFHGKWENTVGHNAPMYAPSSDSNWRKQLSVTYATELWNRLGVPKEKLIIGMPTYGRSFTLANSRATHVNSAATGGGNAGKYSGEEGFLTYYEVCEQLHAGGRYFWDPEMQVPYMVKDDLWVGFDDERAIRNKMTWLKNEGYAGAMVWSIDMDDFSGQVCGGGVKYPLISIMAEQLLGKPRNGKDVEWSQITSVSVATITTLPPPTAIDAKEGLKKFLQNKASSTSEILISTPKDSPKVLCYVTSWAEKRPGAGRFDISYIDPFMCTHIVYAFATLEDNRLAPGKPTDIGDELKPGTYQRLVALKEKNPELKIMIALGGWAFGSQPFRDLVSNTFRMNGFVYDAVEFLRLHELDGLDIDWEYPSGADDKANYVNLLRELRIAFEGEASATGHPRLVLSAAVPASFEAVFAGYDAPEMAKYLDYFNVMTYDFHGQWEETVGHNSPLYPILVASTFDKKLTVDYSIRLWIKEGAPAQKILVGMPAYGRTFTLADPQYFDIGSPALEGGLEGRYTQEAGFLSYYEVCDFLYEDNTTLVWDNEQFVPFAYRGNQWVGFDDERSLDGKVEWMKELNLGGVMIWSVDMDDFRGNCGGSKYPLLNTLQIALDNYTVPITYDGPYENTGTGSGKFTKKDPNVVTCDGDDGVISYHEDVNDCTHYFLCEDTRKHHMPCPVNLVYNPTGTVCDWPENVEKCKDALIKKAAAKK